MNEKQQDRLTEILKRFEELSTQPFSIKRENSIDDIFAELIRFDFDSGDKDYSDHDDPVTRTRCFKYLCVDKGLSLMVQVVIVKGEPGQSRFTVEKNF